MGTCTVGSSGPIICSSSSSLVSNQSITSIGCRANKSSSVIGGSMQIWIPNHLPKRFSFRKLKAKTSWSCTLIRERFRLHFLRNLYMHLMRLPIFSLFSTFDIHQLICKVLVGSPIILLIIVLWSEVKLPTISKFIDC
jgi:hypothetical protein